MGTFSQFEVQHALYAKLTGDATLMGMVTGVHDRVTEGTVYPYVTIGEAAGRDWSTKTSKGQRLLVTIRVFSRSAGRKQAGEIMDRIHTLLHDGAMTVTGHTLIMMRFAESAIELKSDGLTYEGAMRLQLLTEAN